MISKLVNYKNYFITHNIAIVITNESEYMMVSHYFDMDFVSPLNFQLGEGYVVFEKDTNDTLKSTLFMGIVNLKLVYFTFEEFYTLVNPNFKYFADRYLL